MIANKPAKLTSLALALALATAGLIGAGPAAARPAPASHGGGGSGGGSGQPGGGSGGSSGGGSGGSSPATFCPFVGVQPLGDGSGTEFVATEANGAGCVIVWIFDDGQAMAVNQLINAPGWTSAVKGGGGGSFADQVDVQFTQSATGDRVEVRMQPGKTEVK